MIQIQHLTKKFDEDLIFDDIDISLEKGKVMAIIGPSGTGKSTLLRCLNLLETPDAGTITIEGRTVDLAKASKADVKFLRNHISMVFQSPNLYANKTALENITEPLIQVKKLGKAEAEQIAEDLLKKVGVYHRKNSYPITLSGGEQQRVGIARAMGMNSDIILFDEPTSALDPTLVAEVLSVIRKLAEEDTTMIIVTHEMTFAKEISDVVVFMSDQKIVEMGSSEEVFNHPQDKRTIKFLENMII